MVMATSWRLLHHHHLRSTSTTSITTSTTSTTTPSFNLVTRWRLVISFSSCFAGGVFIAACLLDLLPDVEESFEKVIHLSPATCHLSVTCLRYHMAPAACLQVLEEIKHQYNVDLDYPVAQFVIVFGFFIILTIEQAVLHFQVLAPGPRLPMLMLNQESSRSS